MADPEPRDVVVLVADDDALVRSVLRMALASRQIVVAEAADVGETRLVAESRTLQLAVLDVNMPGGTARDAFDSLRASNPKLPILLLSGELTPPANLADVDCEFARKPIELDDFLERVDRLLDRTGNGPRT